jgi:biopolymer transport protein TolR
VIVSIDKDGRFFVGEAEVPDEALIARLMDLRAKDGEAPIYVRGDKGIDYGAIMQLLGKIGQAGFAKVSLIAEAGDMTRGVAPRPVGAGSR